MVREWIVCDSLMSIVAKEFCREGCSFRSFTRRRQERKKIKRELSVCHLETVVTSIKSREGKRGRRKRGEEETEATIRKGPSSFKRLAAKKQAG